MIQFQENAWTEGQTEGLKDGQTLFHRTLLTTARGPKNRMTIKLFKNKSKSIC